MFNQLKNTKTLIFFISIRLITIYELNKESQNLAHAFSLAFFCKHLLKQV